MNPLPLRVTFLPSLLTLPEPQRAYELPAALLLFTTLFEHFVRHPRVAMIDPDDFMITDPENNLLTANHPRIKNVKMYEFYENRRDEVLWFEISLDPARPAPVRLKAERLDGHVDDYAAIGNPANLSESMQNCIQQWLTARQLPPAPRPLEPFGVPDFLQIVDFGFRLMQANAQNPQSAQNMFQVPPKLGVPFCRFAGITLGIYIWDIILKVEADNPWALRDSHLDRWHKGGASRDEIRRIIKMAPAWGKPYGVMWGEGVSNDEWLYSVSVNAALTPGNYFALDGYAAALRDVGRREEAYRLVDRATNLGPHFLMGHIRALDLLDDSLRFGEMFMDADRRLGIVEDMVKRGRLENGNPDVCQIRLRYSNALWGIGRSAEACRVRENALNSVFNPDNWPKMREVLRKWQSDPKEIAAAYGREGYFRGEPGRVIEGLGKIPLDRRDHIVMMIESLLAVGRHDLAMLTFARTSRTQAGTTPRAWLAGARAYVANGRLAPALEYLASFQFRAPQEPVENEINRVLRQTASFPIAQFEAAVQAKLQLGARRIAFFMARDAADFVPGADKSQVITQALAGYAPIAFDPNSLAPLRQIFTGQGIEGVDTHFATYTQPTLEQADKLVNDWLQHVQPAAPEDQNGFKRYAAQLLMTLANALPRYLAMTTQPPNVLAGAYRTIANEALTAIRRDRIGFPDEVIRGLLEAIERVSAIDDWIFDAWLLRVERALDIESTRGAHLEAFVRGLPRVTQFLRGDERISTEYRGAVDGAKDPARAAEVRVLFERCLRAFGGNVASKLSDLVATTVAPEHQLDVHLLNVLANPFNAGAAVHAARVFLQYQRADLAFDVLVKQLGYGGKDWRAKQVAELRPGFEGLRFPVPMDFAQAQTKGYEHMQAGRFEQALQCYQWCDAIDPENQQTLRNLGFVLARLGRTDECIAVASELDVMTGPGLAGHTLQQAGNVKEAVRAYHLAAIGTSQPDAWLYLASAANQAENDELCVEAYTKVFHLSQGSALDLSHLNALAGALDNVGDAAGCEQIAQRMLQMARGDKTYTANATHHLACAYLAQKKFPEAIQHAQQALQMNQLPENQSVFMDTLQRAQRGEPRAVPQRPQQTPEGQAFLAIENGDPRAAQQISQTNGTWKVWRAAFAGYEFRFESENDIPCSKTALDCAKWLLGSTAGSTDADALLVRARALRLREGALFAIDPPPPLGARVPREQFQQMFAPHAAAMPSAPAGSAAGAPQGAAGPTTAADMVLFPGTKLPRLIDYVNLMKAMQSGGNPMTVVAKLGMDMGTYAQLSTQWAQKMAADPNLAKRFQELMSR